MRSGSIYAPILGVPLPGWEGRIEDYRNGRISWPVPDRPDKHATPWPVEWSLLEPVPVELDMKTGVKALNNVQCAVTGVTISADPFSGVRCVRCSSYLSFEAAAIDPRDFRQLPSCPTCRPEIRAYLTRSRGIAV